MSDENRDPQELESEARGALQQHAARVGAEARQRYGQVDWITFQEMLTDDTVARFPVVIGFDADRLGPGEFAWAEPRGDRPRDGYTIWLHPRFRERGGDLVALAAYHLVTVNYGDVATRAEAEAFIRKNEDQSLSFPANTVPSPG